MKIKLLLMFIFVMLFANYVSAFGVSSFYYDEKPLILNPGDTKDIPLILQNEKSSPPISLQAEPIGNLEIFQITGKTIFDLDSGEDNVVVNLRISIPETAKIGDKYSAGASFKSVAKPGNKMLELGTQISKSFPIVIGEVVEEAEETKKPTLTEKISFQTLAGIGIVLLVAVLILLIYRRKKK